MVVQLAQGLSLADKAGHGVGSAGHDLWPEGLDRHELSRVQIGAPVHIAHPAPTEQVTLRVRDLETVADSLTCAHSRTHTRTIARGGLDRGLGPL
jgi:hypothetical protein